MFGRKPLTEKEKEFRDSCYIIGMTNGWCSGEYAHQDGNFIVKEDRLNKNSFCLIDNLKTLKKFFRHGNWCLGQAVIFKNLCFIQQVNGGDEWLVIKEFENETRSFESISFERIITEGEPKEFEKLLKELLEAKTVKEYYGGI